MTATFQAWTHETLEVSNTFTSIVPSTIVFDPRPTIDDVSETTTESGRFYTYRDTVYPSITTMIKATDHEGNKALREWRQAVGADAANAITAKAAKRGTNWHRFAELYVAQQPTWSCVETPEDAYYAAALAHLLNTRIRRVIASESRVISTQYGLAGRVDLCVELHNGKRAIIDFKTGRKLKVGNRLNNYFIQGTFYADALTEIWNDGSIDTVVIVQLLPYQMVWQASMVDVWRQPLIDRIALYADMLNVEMAKTP